MDCVFCDLLQSDTSQWVLRSRTVAVLAPLDPLAPGHMLVIPTAHYDDIFAMPSGLLAETMAMVQRLATAMRTALGAGGVNLLHASGPGSEQSVPHMHLHVVPRWQGDGFSTWPAERSRHRLAVDPGAVLGAVLASGGDGDMPAGEDERGT
ncbi:histidine triad (HIT) family protein [Actinomadura meyerae]|uniref:Histidine triad (HIT) family protein n=1 Tax=Actinomadura meyerae TaxID=240840 RepID=A0A239FE44_9ACTN|nr:HIT domain-containing protein [Actinomadura meyerae]SNS54344.1 histidine triad (HIT) family protein [Actinomadura meyerae]